MHNLTFGVRRGEPPASHPTLDQDTATVELISINLASVSPLHHVLISSNRGELAGGGERRIMLKRFFAILYDPVVLFADEQPETSEETACVPALHPAPRADAARLITPRADRNELPLRETIHVNRTPHIPGRAHTAWDPTSHETAAHMPALHLTAR